MDLVAGVPRVAVLMEHMDKSGASKVLEHCNLPLTGAGVVDLVGTDLAVFEVGRPWVTLLEWAPGLTGEEVRAKTGAPFAVAPGLEVAAANA